MIPPRTLLKSVTLTVTAMYRNIAKYGGQQDINVKKLDSLKLCVMNLNN